jgi:hypothetical protein
MRCSARPLRSPRSRRAALTALLVALATPARAQLQADVTDHGVEVASGSALTYDVLVVNPTQTSFPPVPGGASGTLVFSSGLFYLGATGADWSCAAPVGNQLTCSYFGGLPALGTSERLSVSFLADSASALASCTQVAPPCVRLEALASASPPLAGDVDETHVTGPVVTRWIDPAGGAFSDPGNWSSGVPDADDTAVFDLNATYTISLSAPVALGRIQAYDGDVTLDLVSATASAAELQMGNDPNPIVLSPVLRVTGGGELALGTADLAGDDALLSVQGGSSLRVATQLQLVGFTKLDLSGGAAAVGSGPLPALGTLSVGAGRTLIPNGQIVGDVENGGTVLLNAIFFVAPPDHVTGDYVQLATGTLESWPFVSFSPPARSPELRVGGSAALDGTLRVFAGQFHSVGGLANQTLPFLHAGSISGTFSGFVNETRVIGYAETGTDPAELRFLGAAPCSDSLDNDGDGAVDWPGDSDCASPYPAAGEGPACGLGMEQALLLPLLLGLRRHAAGRRRRRRVSRGVAARR